ncbi:hypothetical protein PHYC_03933 [Phycisphaerales bacterium]|nr:hypothetical protein PHYC_03933 [Phycisphaerales bacterium]
MELSTVCLSLFVAACNQVAPAPAPEDQIARLKLELSAANIAILITPVTGQRKRYCSTPGRPG